MSIKRNRDDLMTYDEYVFQVQYLSFVPQNGFIKYITRYRLSRIDLFKPLKNAIYRVNIIYYPELCVNYRSEALKA